MTITAGLRLPFDGGYWLVRRVSYTMGRWRIDIEPRSAQSEEEGRQQQ